MTSNFAVQLVFAFIVISLAQPVPLQPAKVDPVSGAAVKVTRVPLLYVPEQVLPQLMPAGLLVTVPLPVPDFVIERVKVCGACGLKVAVQVLLAFIVTEIVTEPVVVQPVPLQPAKVEPVAGVAVKVTEVPLL